MWLGGCGEEYLLTLDSSITQDTYQYQQGLPNGYEQYRSHAPNQH